MPTLLMSLFLLILTNLAYSRPLTGSGIIAPNDGAIVVAGSNFSFEYRSKADYGVSSYNYTIWLFTTPPTSTNPSDLFATGYFFGRFSEPNYPGNPYPKNPPPSELTMPDFSQSLGGFGVGSEDQTQQCYFVVLEEYGTGVPAAGSRISWAQNTITYQRA